MRGELTLELIEARDVSPTEVRGSEFAVYCRVCVKEPLRRRFKRSRDLTVRGASFALGEELALRDVHRDATLVVDFFARDPSSDKQGAADELLGKAVLPVGSGESWLELICGELRVRRSFEPGAEPEEEQAEAEEGRPYAPAPRAPAAAAKPEPGPPLAAQRSAQFLAVVTQLSGSAEWRADVEPSLAAAAKAYGGGLGGPAAERAQREAHAAFQEASEGALQAAIEAVGADSEGVLLGLLGSSDKPPPSELGAQGGRVLQLLWAMDDEERFSELMRARAAASADEKGAPGAARGGAGGGAGRATGCASVGGAAADDSYADDCEEEIEEESVDELEAEEEEAAPPRPQQQQQPAKEQPAAVAAAEPSGAPAPEDGRTTIRGLSDESVARYDGELRGGTVTIEDLNNCEVLLLDFSSQVTIDRCANCRFLVGPCAGSVFIRESTSCMLSLACKQLRTRACTHCDLFVHAVGPIVESSSGMRFERWNVWYAGQAAHFAAAKLDPASNAWDQVYDFSQADKALPQPHWSIMPADEFLRWEVRLVGPHAALRGGGGALEHVCADSLPADFLAAELETTETEPPAASPFGGERQPIGKRLIDGVWTLIYEEEQMGAKATAAAAPPPPPPRPAESGGGAQPVDAAYERQLLKVAAEQGWRRTVGGFVAKHAASFSGRGAADRSAQVALHELYAAAAEGQLEETLDKLCIDAEPFLQALLQPAERGGFDAAARGAMQQIRAMEDFAVFVELMGGARSE